jgi:hypothetical protein
VAYLAIPDILEFPAIRATAVLLDSVAIQATLADPVTPVTVDQEFPAIAVIPVVEFPVTPDTVEPAHLVTPVIAEYLAIQGIAVLTVPRARPDTLVTAVPTVLMGHQDILATADQVSRDTAAILVLGRLVIPGTPVLVFLATAVIPGFRVILVTVASMVFLVILVTVVSPDTAAIPVLERQDIPVIAAFQVTLVTPVLAVPR